ncbi:MAG: ABC transporter permease [Clostridiales bacterium]|nr:ABC transporter permease [Clostridiales bacterium]
MLFKKTLRELKQNFGQFFSLFILVALATSLYAGFMADPVGGNAAREKFHNDCALASVWVYGEGFDSDSVDNVRALNYVEAAQLRTKVTGSAVNQNGAELDLYLQKENLVNKPQTVAGEDFNPSDKDGIWLNKNFADEWKLNIGDEFTAEYGGVTFTKTIKGFVLSPEYEYMCASTDAETNFKNICYAYMDFDGFPVKEYLIHQIENDKFTASDLKKINDFDEIEKKLSALGLSLDFITKDKMLKAAKEATDEELSQIMPFTELIIRGDGGQELLSKETEIGNAIGDYAAMVDASSIVGIERLTAELEQHASFSYVFMAIFLAIAILVIATGMSRMVEKQRTQIGTLNAMGFSRTRIVLHYMGFSFLVSSCGAAVGMIAGYFGLGNYIVSMFSQWYVVPGWQAGADWSFVAVAVAVVGVCVLSAFLSCRKVLKIAPSEALRPAAPKSGKHTLFEKLPFWKKLSFEAQYNLRDISRYKMRAVMAIFGTAMGMVLLAGTMSALTMLTDVYDWTFEKIQNFQYEAILTEDVNLADIDALCEQLDGELVMHTGIEVAKMPNAVSGDKSTQTLTVTENKGLFRITDTKAEITDLPVGTVAVTRRLAESMGINIGDTIYWHIYEENDWHSSKVGVINRSPETAGLTMLRADFEKAGCKFSPSLLATNDNSIQTIKNSAVSTVYDINELRAIYEESMKIIWVLVVAMVIFAFAMIIAVLYNTGNLSFHERVKEFATLKVLGFSSKKIRSLITRQNLGLSIIGIILGAPFAKPMLEAMMNSNGENFDYYATVKPLGYLVAGVIVMAVSMAVSLMFTKKIRRLDMVESLKGAE